MAIDILMRRHMGALRPIDAAGNEALKEIGPDELLRVEIKRARNPGHHRKWRALIAAIFPHQETYPTEELLIAAMKVALGFGDTVKVPDGRVIVVPRSLSFAKLDQQGFEEFYTRAVNLILTRILPGVDRKDLEREVADILAGYGSEAGDASP